MKGVNVLVGVDGTRAPRRHIGVDRVQRRKHLRQFGRAEDTRALQFARMGARAGQILGRKPEIAGMAA